MGRWRKLAVAAAGAAIVSVVAVGIVLAHGGGDRDGSRVSPVEILSDLTGVSVEDIRSARQSGDSLADIAEANGVTKDEYVDELVTRAKAAIDAAVEAGRLSEERAQTMKEGLADRVESIVTSTDEPGRGHGWGRGFGHGKAGGKHGGCHSSKSTPAEASASRLAL